MSDTTIINVIEPPIEKVVVNVIETDTVKVNVSEIGERGSHGGQYEHQQAIAASVWDIVHNLGYKPGGIVVKDSAGSLWLPGEIDYIDDNHLTLTFNAAFGGVAYLS